MNSSLIILTGKTASGKDTIKSALLKKYPYLKKVITTTSRTPRNGEKGGLDYHFLTREEFEQKIKQEAFVEWVEYGGNLYGTFKKELESKPGEKILWKIDPSRAGKIRELFKDVVVIYINTPDEIILQRLQKRGLTEQEIEKRMADDKKIWDQYKNNYDYVVENVPGQLSQTIAKVVQIYETKISRS